MTTPLPAPTELALSETRGLAPRFALSLEDLRAQIVELDRFKRDVLQEGTDFATLPGTQKPSLLKPGAEKLCQAFGLRAEFRIAHCERDWERGFFHYEVECLLVNKRAGEIVANGIGEANSREPRYRWRTQERVCPRCGKPAIIKGRQEYGGGWVCLDKKGGCRAKYSDGDQAILGQPTGQVENPEPFELVNTILKQAQKRALVAAVLVGTAASGIFTQDVEDWASNRPAGRVVEDEGRRVDAASREGLVADTAAVRSDRAPANGPAASRPERTLSDPRDPLIRDWERLVQAAVDAGVSADTIDEIHLPAQEGVVVAAGRRLRARVEEARSRHRGLPQADRSRVGPAAAAPSTGEVTQP